MASRPLSPSTMTSRASAAVAATSATRRWPWWLTRSWTYSAPVRVLPKPRPASSSQVRHSPGGGSCSGRAQYCQSRASRSHCSSVSFARSFFCRAGESEASEFAFEIVSCMSDFDWVAALEPGVFVDAHLAPAHPGLGEEDQQRCFRPRVLNPARAPEHGRGDPPTGQRLQFGRTCGDLFLEMLAQGLFVDRLAALRVFDDAANVGLRDAETDHQLDIVALLLGRLELAAAHSAALLLLC